MSTGYQALSQVYDRWQSTYGKDYTTLILPRLLSTIARHRIPRSSMVDVACGTGTLALIMSGKGWDVWGVDASEGMLHEAVRKSTRKHLPVTYLRQDMRYFWLPQPVMLATSLFDSLNHVTSRRDLLKTFRRVHGALQPGGYFVFDVNNERCFRALWTRTEMTYHRDFTMIMQNSYHPARRMAYSLVTVFLRHGEVYERLTEVVQERCFAHQEIRDLLEAAGFRVLEREDFNFTSMPAIGKIKTWWVAQRPVGGGIMSA